ncbi:hypothetical protein PGB28_05220 [Primorskyibacter aestuariivivens]|uniref:hypothetical protein n=1 Tax=Primorskyibacter aestuariivivens TaxID=1888912 RepID=UPI0022FFEED5|nr:hypothetical protein [Primorskyibacter aestuariivivens]MDA7427851.1 hypothetical protein [Primorskyibacter aestuariivivens]
MKQILTATALCLALVTPLAAQEEQDKGTSLMEEGAKLFFKGLMSEMEPALRELEGLADEMEPALRSFAEEMGPALRGLVDKVEDWSAYHPPEILPNGDIIMRRKEPMPSEEPPVTEPEEIEL